ncbi:MAG: phosphocholine cytidylyltransferase family protein [Rhodospirillales bacterium]|jgi:L-glutamine-phosphate cytidylyltransferase|nr:phosphocholine cytidylyltransferase family protein [Rhodospirillales bacterium]
MKGIILAAGRGSRMGKMTEAQPKCMTQLNGKTLLSMQLKSLADAGITQIGIATGYKRNAFSGMDVTLFNNDRWQETNMVSSLAHASEWLKSDECIISYADIFYTAETIRRLTKAPGDLVISFDPDWDKIWSARFEDPLSDAETFKLRQDGTLKEIGARPETMNEVEGQYMGLLKFSPQSWGEVEKVVATLPLDKQDSLDMTGLLNLLIKNGVSISTVPVYGSWGEIDSEEDLIAYEKMIADGSINMPF